LDVEFVDGHVDRLATDERYRRDFAERLYAAVSGQAISVLVNNAAIQILRPIEELSAADWWTTLTTNLLGPFSLIQLLLSDLEATCGSVVNITSIHSHLTKSGFVAYATSKAALEGLTRGLAVELGGRVRVNAVSPAATDTPMLRAGFGAPDEAVRKLSGVHPIGRIAEPAEVANAAVFLASDAASFTTGSVLEVGGGIHARLHDPE
jgi:NAD(P)-dependent dehydrogenase (short-subunit alcohol dehydrogenase family)